MNDLVRTIPRPRDREDETESAGERPPRREWLVTNGLSGYASGTVAGVMTRRFHGLLIAALPAPLGRIVMWNHLLERVRLPDKRVVWLGDEAGGRTQRRGHARSPARVPPRAGLPVWVHQVRGFTVEKRIVMPHLQNTVHVSYRLVDGAGTLRLNLRPSVHFRPHEARVDQPTPGPYTLSASGNRYELSSDTSLPVLRMMLHGGARAALTLDEKGAPAVPYKMEENRGYDWIGSLWSPGYFRADLAKGDQVTLIGSSEPWDTVLAMSPSAHVRGTGAPPEADRDCRHSRRRYVRGRTGARVRSVHHPPRGPGRGDRARAGGDDVRTVIAGYHWFTDWVRDMMNSLEGLTISTRRFREAGYILRTFGQYVRDGLIPNMFPEGDREGLYHTADASLWFFHAIERYTIATGDEDTLIKLLPTLIDIVEHHLRGTRFGIRIDPADGLFTQGAEGYQLTWMDAKVGDWVVTPRRGKAVELNALWYNALCLLHSWTQKTAAARTSAWPGTRRAKSFNNGSGMTRGIPRRGGRRARRRPVVPAEPGVRDLAAAPGARARPLGRRDERRARSAVTPVGLRSGARLHGL
jgi:glycogen debranching enzyme